MKCGLTRGLVLLQLTPVQWALDESDIAAAYYSTTVIKQIWEQLLWSKVRNRSRKAVKRRTIEFYNSFLPSESFINNKLYHWTRTRGGTSMRIYKLNAHVDSACNKLTLILTDPLNRSKKFVLLRTSSKECEHLAINRTVTLVIIKRK